MSRDNDPLQLWEWMLLRPHLQYHWQLFFSLLWETGVRLQEGLNLTATDLSRSGVYVTRLKRDDHPRELIPCPAWLIEELTSYARSRNLHRLFPYSASGAQKALKEAAKLAGIRLTIHPHLFRHGLGRRVAKDPAFKELSKQEHQLLLARMLGHRGGSRNAERYFAPGKEEVSEAFRRIQGR
ncbi:MAG: tyrosine-type recombinase/integrase [Chloroflexi bacterium]|nr:tyrosine-type recombinase/integrase [Chloroflexota bacterium]